MKGITDIDEGTIRRIDWQELIPATMLLRVFSLSLKLCQIAGIAFFFACLLLYFDILAVGQFHFGLDSFQERNWFHFWSVQKDLLSFLLSLGEHGVSHHPGVNCGIVVALLSFFALWLAIGRGAAVRLASTQRSGLIDSLLFVQKKYWTLLKTILVLLFLWSALFLLVGFLSRFGSWLDARFLTANGFPPLVITILFPVLLGLNFALQIFQLVSILALPLMVAAIVTDQSDPFDAIARGFSYLFQRPLHYLFYLTLTVLFGAIGVALLEVLITGTLPLIWNLGHGETIARSPTLVKYWFFFWIQLLMLLPFAYLFFYSVIASTAMYIMLRRSVDGTPFDKFKSDDSHKPSRKLTPILHSIEELKANKENNG